MPATAAMAPMTAPASKSHSEVRAQKGSLVPQKAGPSRARPRGGRLGKPRAYGGLDGLKCKMTAVLGTSRQSEWTISILRSKICLMITGRRVASAASELLRSSRGARPELKGKNRIERSALDRVSGLVLRRGGESEGVLLVTRGSRTIGTVCRRLAG